MVPSSAAAPEIAPSSSDAEMVPSLSSTPEIVSSSSDAEMVSSSSSAPEVVLSLSPAGTEFSQPMPSRSIADGTSSVACEYKRRSVSPAVYVPCFSCLLPSPPTPPSSVFQLLCISRRTHFCPCWDYSWDYAVCLCVGGCGGDRSDLFWGGPDQTLC